jgi:hypothetical protein
VEVDAYQTRQSEIATHKKIYDKHVRSVLKKNDSDDKLFESVLKEFRAMVGNYEQLIEKYITALDSFANLAELQGYLRKAKEAYNILSERKKQSQTHRKEQVQRGPAEAGDERRGGTAEAESEFCEWVHAAIGGWDIFGGGEGVL